MIQFHTKSETQKKLIKVNKQPKKRKNVTFNKYSYNNLRLILYFNICLYFFQIKIAFHFQKFEREGGWPRQMWTESSMKINHLDLGLKIPFKL